MKSMQRSVRVCASVMILALGVAAQSGKDPQTGKDPTGKPAQGQDKEKGKTQEASSRTPAAPVAIPIEGATEANAEAIETALKGMTHPVWKCATCEAKSPTKAMCKECQKEMTEDRTAKVVRDVEVDAASGELRVSVAPAQMLRVSELESKLQASSVKVDKRKLMLPSFSKLYFAAPADAKDAKATVEKALGDSKLFSNVMVKEDAQTKKLVAMVETRGTQASYADVASAVEKAGTGFKLADVALTGPCPGCAKAGNVQANCRGCWHDEGV
jgi:hypothetical protein